MNHFTARTLIGFAIALALAVAAVATVGPTPAQAARYPTVAFNWWHGRHHARHWFGSVRPTVLGGKYGEPVQNLDWLHWSPTGASGKGKVIHDYCQPCRVSVTLTHAKPKPSRLGPGRFFNWMNVRYLRNGVTIRLRWSFRNGNWVGR